MNQQQPNKLKLLVFILVFGGVFSALSQTIGNVFTFRQFSPGNTLNDENIRSVFQDCNGYLWSGLDSEGLCKFNGSGFEIFSHQGVESESILSNYINQIEEDAFGSLWLATEKGLNVFDKKDRFLSSEVCRQSEIFSIIRSSNNAMWVGYENGLLIFSPDEHPARDSSDIPNYRPIQNEITRKMKGIKVTSIFEEDPDNYWIGTTDGLYHYNYTIDRFKHWEDTGSPGSISDNEVNTIVKLNEQFLLIGTDNGVNLFDTNSETFTRLEFKDSGIFNDGKIGIVDIFIDSRGTVWIGTNTYGVITGSKIIREDNKNPVDLNIPSKISGLGSSYITDIIEDRNHQVWIATKFGGVLIYDPRSHTFPFFKLEEKDGIPDQDQSFILSVEEDSFGKLWIGTRDRGLLRYDPLNKKYDEFKLHQGIDYVRRVEIIYSDENNYLWIGHKKGLNRINLITGEKVYYELPKVVSIQTGPDKKLWLGTHSGLYVIQNPHTPQPQKIDLPAGPSLVSPQITIILWEDESTLWIGTDNQGLLKYNPIQNKVTHFDHRLNSPKSLSGNTIRSILIDSRKDIWIGTKSSGLNLLVDDNFLHFTENDGLPSNTVFSILEDQSGMFWITSNNGLSRFDPTLYTSNNFTKRHGLQGNVFEKHAAKVLSDGKIFIAGNNGYNLFSPEEIYLEDYRPPLVINQIKANAQPVASNLFKPINLNLEHHQNILSFEFSALDFRDIEAMNYQYQLIGIDQSWVSPGSKNTVTYSNLPHGKYTFQVKATNADGIWSEEILTSTIVISRPPWLAWWAITGYILVILGFLYLIYWWAKVRTTFVHNIRTKELELKQSNELNQLKLNFFTNISHELRTPLTLILAPLEKLRKSHHRDHIHKSITMAYKSARQLLHLTDQLIYFRKVEQGALPLKVCQVNLANFVNDLILPFYQLAASKSIKLEYHPEPKNQLVWFDSDKIEKIINNLLINAFKFTTSGGQIDLFLMLDVDKVLISVKDTGEGIDQDHIDHIFDRYYQADGPQKGSGIGLELVKSLVTAHHGTISVDSKRGVGTQFDILLNISKESYSDEEISEHSNLDYSPNDVYLLPEDAHFIDDVANKPETDYHLLVVEDNKELRHFIASTLETQFKIVLAKDGQEALHHLKYQQIDLVLADVMMPGMTGFELCKKIKENISTSHVPVVMLTARAMEEHQIEGFESGAEAYILKPFDTDILKARLIAILKNRERVRVNLKDQMVFDPDKIATNALDQDFVSRILTIIDQNHQHTNFSVESFANDLNMSRSQLFRKLKTMTGQTPSEFLFSYRIKKATTLLKKRDLNIAEIAYQTGFSTPNSFTKTFTKHMGISPSKFIARV